MPATTPPFAPVAQCDEIPSTSCTEGEEAPLVHESQARARGVWKVAVVATVTGLIAAAGTWRSQSRTSDAVSEEVTGLATGWAAYGTIGCSNWASIEISRSQVADQNECATKCIATAGCTMYNWQATACEPGWPVANGCLLFKESCNTERNNCWELNYKLEVAETVVTQTVTLETSASKEDTEKAVKAAMEDPPPKGKGIKPVETTAKAARRLLGEDRRNIAMFKWAVTWVFKTLDPAAGDAAYSYAEEIAKGGAATKLFSARVKTAMPPGTETKSIEVAEPVKESGGTTITPDVETTM